MIGAMGRLAEGDLQVTIPDQDRSDEIGRMAAAVQVFKDNAIERERLAATQAKQQEARQRRAQRIEAQASAFELSVGGLLAAIQQAASDLKGSAVALTRAAEQSGHRSGRVQDAAQDASANVQTVSAAAEQLASSISEIGRQVTSARQIAEEAA